MSNGRKAISAGATVEEVEHAILLAMTTTGFPNTIAVLRWGQEVLAETKS